WHATNFHGEFPRCRVELRVLEPELQQIAERRALELGGHRAEVEREGHELLAPGRRVGVARRSEQLALAGESFDVPTQDRQSLGRVVGGESATLDRGDETLPPLRELLNLTRDLVGR